MFLCYTVNIVHGDLFIFNNNKIYWDFTYANLKPSDLEYGVKTTCCVLWFMHSQHPSVDVCGACGEQWGGRPECIQATRASKADN